MKKSLKVLSLCLLNLLFILSILIPVPVSGMEPDALNIKEVFLTDSDFEKENGELIKLNDEGVIKLNELQSHNGFKRLIIKGEEVLTTGPELFKDISLDSVYITGSITEIKDSAFKNMGLTDLYLENVKITGKESFAYNKLNVFQAENLEIIGEGAFKDNSIENFKTNAKTIYKYAFLNNPLKELNLENPEVVLDTEVFTEGSGVKVTGENLNFISNDKNTYLVNPLDMTVTLKDTDGNILSIETFIKEKAEIPFIYEIKDIEGYIKPFDVISIENHNTDIVYNREEVLKDTEIPEIIAESPENNVIADFPEDILNTENQSVIEYIPENENNTEIIDIIQETEINTEMSSEINSEVNTEIQPENYDTLINSENMSVSESPVTSENTEEILSDIMPQALISDSGDNFKRAALPSENITFEIQTDTHDEKYAVGKTTFGASAKFIVSGNELVKNKYKIVFTMPEHTDPASLSAPGISPDVEVIINNTEKPYTVTYIFEMAGGHNGLFRVNGRYEKFYTPMGFPGIVEASAYYGDTGELIEGSLKSDVFPAYYEKGSIRKEVKHEPFVAGIVDEGFNYFKENTENDYTYRINMASADFYSRSFEKIIITDKLPLYNKYDSITDSYIKVPAKFDPAKNPGWILSEDGLYAVTEIFPVLKTTIDKGYKTMNMKFEYPEIVLSYPMAKDKQYVENNVSAEFVIDKPLYEDKNYTSSARVGNFISGAPVGRLLIKKAKNVTINEEMLLSGKGFGGFSFDSRRFGKDSYINSPKYDLVEFIKKPIVLWDMYVRLINDTGYKSDSIIINDSKIPDDMVPVFLYNPLKSEPDFKIKYKYLNNNTGRTTEGVLTSEDSLHIIDHNDRNYIDNIQFEIDNLTEYVDKHFPGTERSIILDKDKVGVTIGTEFKDGFDFTDITDSLSRTNEADFIYNIKNSAGNISSFSDIYKASFSIKNQNFTFWEVDRLTHLNIFTDGTKPVDLHYSANIDYEGFAEALSSAEVGRNPKITYIIPKELYVKDNEGIKSIVRISKFIDENNRVHANKFLGDVYPDLYNIETSFTENGDTKIEITAKDPEYIFTVKEFDIDFRGSFYIKPISPEGKYKIQRYYSIDTSPRGINYQNEKVNPYSGEKSFYAETEITYSKNKLFSVFKEVSNDGKFFSTEALTPAGSEFEYKIILDNSLDDTAENVEFIDVFPYEGDYDLIPDGNGKRHPKESAFSNEFIGIKSVKLIDTTGEKDITGSLPVKFIKKGAVLPKDNSRLSLWYEMNKNAFTDDSSDAAGIICGGDFFDIPGNSRVEVIFKMKAPHDSKVSYVVKNIDILRSLEGRKGVNTVAYRYGLTDNEFTEANKAYNTFTFPEPPEDEFTGSATLIKTDETSEEPLSNVLFELSKDGEKITEKETDDAGKIFFGDLIPGEYILKEIKSPDGYIKSDEEHKIIVKPGENTEINITNKINLRLHLYKQDVNKDTIEYPSEFTLKDLKTGKETHLNLPRGVISHDIVLGEYEITEIKAPEGYRLNSKPLKINITKDNIKLSGDKSYYYYDAEFTDYKITEELPGTGTTGLLPSLLLSLSLITFSFVFTYLKKRTLF